MMNHEYIVPMTDQARKVTLYPSSNNGGNCIPNFSLSTSLKPDMHFTSPCFVWNYAIEGDCVFETVYKNSPEIPLNILKTLTAEMLMTAVHAVCQDVRDPIGGNVEVLLVPLIRLFYALLVMGVFKDEDLGKVLRLLDPAVFPRNLKTPMDGEEEDASDDEQECKGCHPKRNDTPEIGLLQMKLPEAVKLEVKVTAHFFGVFCVHTISLN